MYIIFPRSQHKSNPEVCTNTDILLKGQKYQVCKFLYLQGTRKGKVYWRQMGTTIGKVQLCQIIKCLGQQVMVYRWYSTDSGKSLQVFK